MALINELIKRKILKTPEIIMAFNKIDRKDFVRLDDIEMVEVNAPLPIGSGQTISQPETVAIMLELLQPRSGDIILDIGSGSGWTTALLAQIVGDKGKIFGIEIVPELCDFGRNNVNKYNFIDKGTVQIICSDGNKGLAGESPFNKILISAAAKEFPWKLFGQLKIGGRMIFPQGEEYSAQDLVVIEKIGENKYNESRYYGFVFVPLVSR